MQSYKLLMLIGGVLVAACGDAATEASARATDLDVAIPTWLGTPEPSTAPPGTSMKSGSDAPENLPVEFQGETSLQVEAYVSIHPGFLRGEAIARYWATNGEVELDFKLLEGWTEIGSIPQRTTQSDYYPAGRSIMAAAEHYIDPTCGYGGRADARGKAYQHALLDKSWFTWGTREASASATGRQPSCSPSGAAGGDETQDSQTYLIVCTYTAERFGDMIIIHEHGCTSYKLRDYAM